jgi:acyl-CoA thioester hydrolase
MRQRSDPLAGAVQHPCAGLRQVDATRIAKLTTNVRPGAFRAEPAPSIRQMNNADGEQPAARGGAEDRPGPRPRAHFAAFHDIASRWMDNDVYGHINNVVYYSFFDTAVNGLLIAAGVLDIHGGDVIGLVVETHCNYFAPIAFPQAVTAGVRVAQLGRSSVRYEIGLFAGDAPESAAAGHFIHVYVDRATRRPVPLPEPLKAVLRTWTLPASDQGLLTT